MSVRRTVAVSGVAFLIGIAGLVVPGSASASQPACKTGYYENAYGNCVKRPGNAPSVPAGAMAKCGDGTYSYSQTHSGTCSHHGGVATWYRSRTLAAAA